MQITKVLFLLLELRITSNFVLVEFFNLHKFSGIPVDGVIVKISSRVKPEVKLLFPLAYSLCIYICMDNVWLSWNVTQELKIYLVMQNSWRG